MKTKLIPLRAGFSNVYLLIERGNLLLIDTGTPNLEKRILKAITSRGYRNEDLKFIFLTHAHYDHAGSAAALKEITGAKIILHENEKENLEVGFAHIPKGTNRFFKMISYLGRNGGLERKIGRYRSTLADFIFSDQFDLKPHGFDAKLIHTPGHTMGSSTLLVNDTAIVGDVMFNLTGKYYPCFANDEKALLKTWKKFSEMQVRWFYPSHGKRIEKTQFLKQARQKGVK